MAGLECSTFCSMTSCRLLGNSLVSSSGSASKPCSWSPPGLTAKVVLRTDFDMEGVRPSSCVTRAATPGTTQSDEYNMMMKRQMRNPYEYHHELGMYYTRILPNLIVGSQPQSSNDIDKLFYDEKVGAILNLQQDKDVEFWGMDLPRIVRRCGELGVWHIRRPARDFDGNSLRRELPRAVSALEHAIEQGRTVCVHCTAGLGRAPAVAIAYLFWFHNLNLEEAYKTITSKRPCGPKKEAIRAATYDLVASKDSSKPRFEDLSMDAFSDVAGWERLLIQDLVRNKRWS